MTTNSQQTPSLPLAKLAVVGAISSLMTLAVVGLLVFAFAGASDATGELGYVPITPCKILNTADGTGGYTGNQTDGAILTVDATATATCPAVPSSATGVDVNLIANGTARGNLKLTESGVVTDGSVVNFGASGETNSNAAPTSVDANGQFDVTVKVTGGGDVRVVAIILGYWTDDVEARVDRLETLLAGLSIETVDGYNTLRLSGMNFQVVSGQGQTYNSVNGYGNIIIGYHQNIVDTRTGSHNLIVGDRHSYSQAGSILFGFDNTTTSNATAVTGGSTNTASNVYAVVNGGQSNTASSLFSAVSGGEGNTASGDHSSVVGGLTNTADGEYSVVSGGTQRSAFNIHDWVAGTLLEDN